MKADITIIGGGPAGLAAAEAARQAGVENIIILERDNRLGGILNQCIHNGFGLHTFQEELTGPEYAQRFVQRVEELQIPYILNTMVVDVSKGEGDTKIITAMNAKEGLFTIESKAVILAMGCRERARGSLNIPGYRPAGIYSAGTAQHYVNIEGRMPGKEVVILGSGDIGLIMARRMTLEGAVVKVVAELMPYSGGLKRNIVQCLDDYGIPLKLSHTVVNIHGKERVEGITLAQVDEKLKPIPGTEEYIACDTLLLSCGLIPENELSLGLGVEMNPVTSGPVVDQSLETNVPGVFACGNVLHVHDLVDFVSGEAAKAGSYAAAYVWENSENSGNSGNSENRENSGNSENSENRKNRENSKNSENTARKKQEERSVINIRPVSGVRYTVPARIYPDKMEDQLTVRFRVGNVYKNKKLVVRIGDEAVMTIPKRAMAPGEMEQVILQKKKLQEYDRVSEIIIAVED